MCTIATTIYTQAKYEAAQAAVDACEARTKDDGDTLKRLRVLETDKRTIHAEYARQKKLTDAESQRVKELEDEVLDVTRRFQEAKAAHDRVVARATGDSKVSDILKRGDGARDDKRREILAEYRRERLVRATNPEAARPMEAVTWNIAAVNNNPFEYWIAGTDEYNKLMEKVSQYMSEPGSMDVPVAEVFTPAMWEDLKGAMKKASMNGVEVVDERWEQDFKARKVISEFMKDKMIGKKRLASMLDRVTNTMATASGALVMRPTVINCYEGDLGTTQKWYEQWKTFLFDTEVTVVKRKKKSTKVVFEMLKKIEKAKYPDVTEEEEKVSIPLQIMAAAIFDATLVHMMNTALPGRWQELRQEMCDKLNKGKNDRVARILSEHYGEASVVFVQEASSDFEKAAKASPDLLQKFDLYVSEQADASRGQNSLIMLRKGAFGDADEVTENVLRHLSADDRKGVANGDLLVLSVQTQDGVPFLFASFHGDTNGLMTKPVVAAVREYALSQPDAKLLFGMDANTHARPQPDQAGIVDFAEYYRTHGLSTCYGNYPNPLNFTTFHARTHLQTQLNKAVALKDRDRLGDKNPKDHIMFWEKDFHVVSTTKDNTGERRYVEDMVFPTLTFPSDHGITSTVLRYPSRADRVAARERERAAKMASERAEFEVATWNIAAVNNNPFEYWINGTDEYNKLMEKVSQSVTSPGDLDVRVSEVFTPAMWAELRELLARKVGEEGLGEVADVYTDDFGRRKMISEFLTDTKIGKKRLASMPDRVTNTITTTTGKRYRPTVINCYEGDLSSAASWWKAWKAFMFEDEVTVLSKGDAKTRNVYKLLKPISRSKYPEVTAAEERLSIPLQILSAAIFDATLVRVMHAAAPGKWEPLRQEMCEKLNKGKNKRVVEILGASYAGAEALFLQETSNDFLAELKASSLGDQFDAHASQYADAGRGQNSLVLLKNGQYRDVEEVTKQVAAIMVAAAEANGVPDAPVAEGDLIVLRATHRISGERFLFASFHGDTDGLATIPVTRAVADFAERNGAPSVIFGMDANTHARPCPKGKSMDIMQFSTFLKTRELTTCYGEHPNPRNFTTFHARTHLQTQLNKAVALADRDEKGDKNPKDHIVFPAASFTALSTTKDNTGERRFVEDMVFPTLTFPSDHGITSTVLQRRKDRPYEAASVGREVAAVTWNVAAVNNNPFEYWINGTDEYNKLMEKVSALVEEPGAADVEVSAVFTQSMWEELKGRLTEEGLEGVSAVDAVWEKDFKDRKIVSGFLKDKAIGSKRLASMFDRVSSTVVTTKGVRMFRPSPVTCYAGEITGVPQWWAAWNTYVFDLPVAAAGSKEEATPKRVVQLLKAIRRAKYPAVTEEEERVSLALQTLAGAIFDAVWVHLLVGAAPGKWDEVRGQVCEALGRNKDASTAAILTRRYYNTDVVFLQEVGASLARLPELRSDFAVATPSRFDAQRGQNSVILLKKHVWRDVAEVTPDVEALLVSGGAPVDAGDLFAVTAKRSLNGTDRTFLLVSFHGDTDGLATKPVVAAVQEYAQANATMVVVLGLDANTYERPKSTQQGVADFASFCAEHNLTTGNGDTPDPSSYTTFHARTHLQTQLNKAVPYAEKNEKGDRNPKDHIVFSRALMGVRKGATAKDNTGERAFVEDMVFPTMQFPSDHSIVSTLLLASAASEETHLG